MFQDLIKVLDEEYSKSIRSTIRDSLESCFSTHGKNDLDADAIQKLLAYRVIDIGCFVENDIGIISTVASDFEAKTSACTLFPVCP